MFQWNKEYGDEQGEKIFCASKNAGKITGIDGVKDTDIIINIQEENESEDLEQPLFYKDYTIKQDETSGEFEVYSPGGTIIANCKTLELAKIHVDNIDNI